MAKTNCFQKAKTNCFQNGKNKLFSKWQKQIVSFNLIKGAYLTRNKHSLTLVENSSL